MQQKCKKVFFQSVFIILFLFCFRVEAIGHSIVFIHIGKEIPPYASVAFSQARAFNPDCPIYIIAQGKALNKLFSQGNKEAIIGVDYDKLHQTEEHKKFRGKSKLHSGFWLYTSERFLYLYDFMRQYNLENVFHLEYDNMLYTNLGELLPVFKSKYQGIGATFDNDERCIPGFVYISDIKGMESLAKYFAKNASKGWNDMQVLAQFKIAASSSQIDHLPIIMSEYANNQRLISSSGHQVKDVNKYSQNDNLFHSIFDAAALGQYLGGTDVIHQGGGIPGFINESCIFNPSLFSYEWLADDEGRLVPYVIYADKSYKINNLHVHSKNLEAFSSFRKI